MIELHPDEAALLGALLDHAAAWAKDRRILLVADTSGVKLLIGARDELAGHARALTPALGTEVR